MARRKPKPAAPIDRQSIEAEKARLEAIGASYTLDRSGRIMSAWRSNVFNLLLSRGTITPNHHDAATTLAKDWAAWKGLDGKPETFGAFVDGGSGCAELVTDRMLKAGRRVEDALSAVEPVSRIVLERFMVATVEEDRPMAWRGILERVGIRVRDRQTQAVVMALEELRVVYEGPGRVAA